MFRHPILRCSRKNDTAFKNRIHFIFRLELYELVPGGAEQQRRDRRLRPTVDGCGVHVGRRWM